jgi:hypothetical protein
MYLFDSKVVEKSCGDDYIEAFPKCYLSSVNFVASEVKEVFTEDKDYLDETKNNVLKLTKGIRPFFKKVPRETYKTLSNF